MTHRKHCLEFEFGVEWYIEYIMFDQTTAPVFGEYPRCCLPTLLQRRVSSRQISLATCQHSEPSRSSSLGRMHFQPVCCGHLGFVGWGSLEGLFEHLIMNLRFMIDSVHTWKSHQSPIGGIRVCTKNLVNCRDILTLQLLSRTISTQKLQVNDLR